MRPTVGSLTRWPATRSCSWMKLDPVGLSRPARTSRTAVVTSSRSVRPATRARPEIGVASWPWGIGPRLSVGPPGDDRRCDGSPLGEGCARELAGTAVEFDSLEHASADGDRARVHRVRTRGHEAITVLTHFVGDALEHVAHDVDLVVRRET